MAAYLVGCSIMNAAPKQAENVACGSFMPSSVPATFSPHKEKSQWERFRGSNIIKIECSSYSDITRAVYPLMKWYMVCDRFSLLTGGSTPNASHAKRITFFGWGPTHGNFTFGMYSIGYAARVFSATWKSSIIFLYLFTSSYHVYCPNKVKIKWTSLHQEFCK